MGKDRSKESRLRDKLNRFLRKPGRVGLASATLKKWDGLGWGPVLFGGVVRDLVVLGARNHPRDVDVVLQNADIDAVARTLPISSYHQNRFGGLHLILDKWIYDVWLLDKTWAFTVEASFAPSLNDLPKTTFLNVEAIAVSIEKGRVSKIFTHGFFEAVAERRIDINYENNPFPHLNAVRAVLTAQKLHFDLSPRLARYFLRALSDDEESLVDAQEKHYGKVVLPKSSLSQLRESFSAALEGVTEDGRIALPLFMAPKQLRLW